MLSLNVKTEGKSRSSTGFPTLDISIVNRHIRWKIVARQREIRSTQKAHADFLSECIHCQYIKKG